MVPDESSCALKTRQSKIWLESLHLRQCDKEILLSPTGWLNDALINAAQNLLAKQFPNLCGFQNSLLNVTMGFTVQSGEFLQIINTGHQHWVTISTIGVNESTTVKVYDSLYDFFPSLAQAQVASILHTHNDFINVEIMEVEKQVSDYLN